MKNGCMGKILWVDLGRKTINEEPIPETQYRKYLSGIGLASKLLYDRIPAGADPLNPVFISRICRHQQVAAVQIDIKSFFPIRK